MSHRALIPAALLLAGACTAGCANPDAATRETAAAPAPASPGESAAPAPTRPGGDARRPVGGTAQAALLAFATLYVNWDYRTLSRTRRSLAASAVGSARAAELQAAASSRNDPTITAGRIRNTGTVLSVSPERGEPGRWVIVTRERTSGGGEYEGLPFSDHVTLARVAALGQGYAVSEWLPQS